MCNGHDANCNCDGSCLKQKVEPIYVQYIGRIDRRTIKIVAGVPKLEVQINFKDNPFIPENEPCAAAFK